MVAFVDVGATGGSVLEEAGAGGFRVGVAGEEVCSGALPVAVSTDGSVDLISDEGGGSSG